MRITKAKQNIIYSLLCVFTICITTGYIAGNMIKANNQESFAASENITVANNNQVVTYEQASGTLSKGSMVTVKDPAAVYGHNLYARIAQNSNLPANTVVTVNGKTLSRASPTLIASTDAYIPDGYPHYISVTIRFFSSNTPIGNYILDIEYEEEAKIRPMQNFRSDDCSDMPTGSMIYLRDDRDDTHYRVKKMADGSCWMVDNLAYNINSASSYGKPAYATTPEFDSTPNGAPNLTSVATRPQYAQNISDYDIPNNGSSKASYLYNWCAALGDVSTNCSASSGATQYQTVLDGTTTATTSYTATNQPAIIGICPAPFRLPKGGPVATSSNPSSTANEFVKLDIAMGGTGTDRADTTLRNKLMGAGTSSDNWLGVYSGTNNSGLTLQSSLGNWWSAMANDDEASSGMNLENITARVNPANNFNKSIGRAVRCVLR